MCVHSTAHTHKTITCSFALAPKTGCGRGAEARDNYDTGLTERTQWRQPMSCPPCVNHRGSSGHPHGHIHTYNYRTEPRRTSATLTTPDAKQKQQIELDKQTNRRTPSRANTLNSREKQTEQAGWPEANTRTEHKDVRDVACVV